MLSVKQPSSAHRTLGSLLLLAFFFFQCTGPNSNQQGAATDAAAAEYAARLAAAETRPDKYAVRPPFEDAKVNVAPTSHTVQPGQSTTLTLPTGTTIVVPAAVFVTLDGQPVTKPVDIQFREFHNAAQIIASGIPMKVRGPNGEEDWMQTAGMFEIKGFSEGREVKIAPGKSVTVNLASEVSGEYPVWYFDPAAGNWAQQGANNPTPNPEMKPLAREVAALRSAVARPPVAPVAFDQSKPSLDFKLNISEFPELRTLRNIVWQYAGNDPKLDPANNRWIKKTNWSEAKLDPGKSPNQYTLTLVGDEQDYVIPVQPSLSGNDLAAAKATYEQAMVKYRTLEAALNDKQAVMEQQAAFRRSLQVEGFGIYNYDLLLHRADALAVVADFDFGDDFPKELKKLATVYLITGDGRTVVELPYYNWSSFSYLPGKDSRMVAILPGNRIATFSQADFQEQRDALFGAKGSPYVFKMSTEGLPVASEQELEQRILNPGETGPRNTASKSLVLEKVFPNPLQDAVTVAVSSPKEQTGRIRLVNMSGAMMLDEEVRFVEGDNQFNYTLPGNLVAGAYSVVAVGADGKNVAKQVVKR